MKKLEVNFYNSVKSPQVLFNIDVAQWFEQIKNPIQKDLITKAREGELDYREVKLTKIPAVTYNFLYDGYKKDTNIVGSTGLLYIDIDRKGFDISVLNLKYVCAYYKSFGGQGWSIVVKVDNLKKENFHLNYLNICDSLGVRDYIDINAIKASQYNVLSYDPDIYINMEAETFKAVEDIPLDVYMSSVEEKISTKLKPHKKVDTGEVGKVLRFDNIDDYDFDGDFISDFEDGYKWVRCFIPSSKLVLGRNNFLLSFCNNLVWLNPSASKEVIFATMQGVNKIGCMNPVDSDHLKRVVDSIFTYKNDGTLKPIFDNRDRKIIFAKGTNLTKEEKLEIVRELIAERKRNQSLSKISNILEEWDFDKYGKISVTNIHKNFPISRKTVAKYYHLFKEDIQSLNKVYSK